MTDGVAQQAIPHPITITAEMRHAGAQAIEKLISSSTAEPSGVLVGVMAEAAYIAMTLASPWEDPEISEDALETVEIEVEVCETCGRPRP